MHPSATLKQYLIHLSNFGFSWKMHLVDRSLPTTYKVRPSAAMDLTSVRCIWAWRTGHSAEFLQPTKNLKPLLNDSIALSPPFLLQPLVKKNLRKCTAPQHARRWGIFLQTPSFHYTLSVSFLLQRASMVPSMLSSWLLLGWTLGKKESSTCSMDAGFWRPAGVTNRQHRPLLFHEDLWQNCSPLIKASAKL